MPATSTTSQFALKIQKNFLAEKYEEGQKKNCHWGLGSQKLKLGAPGLFKKGAGTLCPPPTKLGLINVDFQQPNYLVNLSW